MHVAATLLQPLDRTWRTSDRLDLLRGIGSAGRVDSVTTGTALDLAPKSTSQAHWIKWRSTVFSISADSADAPWRLIDICSGCHPATNQPQKNLEPTK